MLSTELKKPSEVLSRRGQFKSTNNARRAFESHRRGTFKVSDAEKQSSTCWSPRAARAPRRMDFKWQQGFWGSFAKRTKGILLEDEQPSEEAEASTTEPKAANNELQRGLNAIASSLSRLGDTLGSAIEEIIALPDARPKPDKENAGPKAEENSLSSINQQREKSLDDQTQLKASRDVAVAMASKVKLLLRELKAVKGNLAFMKERCSQLEEENKRLRESLEKGLRPDDDDLVRKQIEALVAEKSRLSQENTNYARENQFLHEVIEYHRLGLQELSLLDESIIE